MHIFSKRGSLECVLLHWRDLKSKSKSELKLFQVGASCAALTFMGIDGTGVLGSPLLFVLVVFPLRRCLRACNLPAYPCWEITLFAVQHADPAADQIVRSPSGGCRGDLIWTPDSGHYRVFYKSFLWGNLRFGECFEKPSLQALFWCKKLRSRQNIGKVTKRRRSVKPTGANGGTNRANGGTNASFWTSGDFHFFLARGQICFEFDSATVKREKKKERRKTRLWAKAKRRDFFNFSQSLVFGERNRQLFTPGAKNFSCSRRRCSCVVRFACAWLNGLWTSVKVLHHERDRENGPLFQFKLCVTILRVFRFAQRRPSNRCRWSSNDLWFHFGRTQIRGARHWGGKSACMAFFWFENSFCQSKWSKKKGKQANASLRPIVGSKKAEKKVIMSSLEYTRTWVRSIKRRALGPRQPRDRPGAGPREPAAVKWPSKPKAKIAVQGLLMSAQYCLVFVLNFQSWRIESEEDKLMALSLNRPRSKFGDLCCRTRGRITKSVMVTTVYDRTIRSGTAGSV